MKEVIGLIILSSVLLTGCGTVQMTDFDLKAIPVKAFKNQYSAELYSVVFDYNLPSNGNEFGNNFKVPLLWKDLTKNTLTQSGVFKNNATKQVDVVVNVTYADLPVVGFSDMTTRLEATYSIIDRGNGESLFSKEIRSESRIPISYALAGVKRAEESTRVAVTSNVDEFIEALRSFVELPL